MNNIRTLAAAVTSVAIAAALVVGLGAPANAATGLNPIPGPIVPGPQVPPIPPGTVFRPVIQFPGCPSVLSSVEVTWVRRTTPSFRYLGTSTTAVGATESTLTAIALSERHSTCIFGSDSSRPMTITTVAINSAEYARLFHYYDLEAHIYASVPGSPLVQGAGAADRLFYSPSQVAPGTNEYAFLSADGWWITVTDHGNDPTTYSAATDAARQFLALNFSRS